jgi:hypothetical protein
MAAIASSTSLPMVGCGALAFRCDQRACFGAQKMPAVQQAPGRVLRGEFGVPGHGFPYRLKRWVTAACRRPKLSDVTAWSSSLQRMVLGAFLFRFINCADLSLNGVQEGREPWFGAGNIGKPFNELSLKSGSILY